MNAPHPAHRLIAAISLAASLISAPVSAATLSPADFTDTTAYVGATNLFTGAVQRDQTLRTGAAAGNDWIIQNGAGATTSSGQFAFAGTGQTVSNALSWSLALSGTALTSTLGGQSTTAAVTSGTWDGISLFLSAGGAGLRTATTTFVISAVNGVSLSDALTLSVTDGTTAGSFLLGAAEPITSLSGTLTFSYTRSGNNNQSPGAGLQVRLSALDVTAAPPQVPLPASLGLLATALGALGLMRRRSRA